MSDHGNNLDPVVKTRRVPLPPDQAFTLFSADMGSWWPLASHSVSGSADARVSFGVRAGGTVDEHAPDGTTHVWAEVLAAEPADRVVLTWHPGAEANALGGAGEETERGQRVVVDTVGAFRVIGRNGDVIHHPEGFKARRLGRPGAGQHVLPGCCCAHVAHPDANPVIHTRDGGLIRRRHAIGRVPDGVGRGIVIAHPQGTTLVQGSAGFLPGALDETVADVVMMGATSQLGWFRRAGRRERELARDCLERVGLADFASRQIGRLSGGQQQRVFLARALAREADIYLLDEPMAGVDAGSQEQIFGILAGLRDAGKLVVAVHHDLQTAARWFDAVALVDMRLVAAGSTAEVLTADNLNRTYAGRAGILDELGRAVARGKRTP